MADKARIAAGFEGDRQDLEVKVPRGDPPPWGLDDKLAVVGAATPRVDALAKVTGRAKFTHDQHPAGMLFARVLRCPFAHARVLSVDATKAKALSGVKAVWKVEAKKELKCPGEEVAAVAAISPQVAEDALRLIDVRYERLPFVVDLEEARLGGAPAVHGRGGNVRKGGVRDRGDIEKGFAEAEVVLERTYSTQVQTHACLETHGVVARWEGEGELTVWASTQATFSVRDDLAGAFGLDANRVRVIAEHVGGGFGSKFGAGSYGAIAARLAKDAGAPVKLMLDREAEHLVTGNRPSSVQWMKVGARKDGQLTAVHVKSYGTAGIGGGAGVANPMIYRFGNVRKEEADVFTNAGPGAPMRAPGHPQGAFALESMLDEVALAIGMDPLELRRKNDPSPVRLHEYALGAKRIGWERRRAKPGSDPGPRKRGLGMGSTRWGGLGGAGASVLAILAKDGAVEVQNGAQDIGTGTRTVMAVIAAEELGLAPEQVTVRLGDTRWPFGPGSGGSTTAPSIAPAVRAAAARLKSRLFEAVAPTIGADPADLRCAEGRVFVARAPEKFLTWNQAASLIPGDTLTAQGDRAENYETYKQGSAGCQFAEVEVDVETGVVRVVKVVAVQDCGRIVDRLTAESQVLGGVIQGLSFALFEERVLDRKTGYMVNPNLEMYKIAGADDMPEIDAVLVDVANGGNNVGLLGLGEPPVIPTAAAIANAVANAIGARVRSLPITPGKVLEALAAAERPAKDGKGG